MHQKNSTGVIASIFAAGTLSASAAWAATTPYDLIRPTWPLSWDATVFEKFDTTITQKTGMLPASKTPESFKPGELMPDTHPRPGLPRRYQYQDFADPREPGGLPQER